MDDIKQKKEGLIEYINKVQQKTSASITIQAELDSYLTSNLQKALYLNARYGTGNVIFKIKKIYELDDVDHVSLLQALYTLIERYEILRTTLLTEGNSIKQRIDTFNPQDLDMKVLDMGREKDQIKRVEEVLKQMDEEYSALNLISNQCIALKISIRILTVDDKKHILILSIPSVIADLTSVKLLEQDMFEIYNSYLNGRELNLKPVKTQFKDYVAWVNDRLEGEEGQNMKSYWSGILHDLPQQSFTTTFSEGVNSLPNSYSLTIRQQIREVYGPMNKEEEGQFMGVMSTVKHESVDFSGYIIDQTKTDTLESLATQTDTTLSTVIISTFKILLYRLFNQTETYVGLTVSQRDNKMTKDIVGNLTNNILVRSDFDRENTLIDLIKNVQDKLQESSDFQVFPLERLLNEFDIPLHRLETIFLNIVTAEKDQELSTTRVSRLSHSPFDLCAELFQFN